MCVCTGFPGGSVVIYMCAFMYLYIYTHTYMRERQREKDRVKKKKEKESKGKETNYKEVTHMIIQAPDLQLPS